MKKKKTITPATNSIQKKSLANVFLSRFDEQTTWQLIVLLLLPFFIYIKTVNFQFIEFDDVAIIRNNIDILSHLKNIGIAFKTDAFLSSHGDFYRPIQTVSFILDTLIGGGKPWIYHLSSLTFHLLTVVSLYFFLRFLQMKNTNAFLFVLLFAMHPLLSSAVSWIPARGDILIGLFGVLLFFSFGKYFKTGKVKYLLAHIILFCLSAFTKETAILFPILLLFFYLLVLKEKIYSLKILPFVIIWIIVLVAFLICRNKVANVRPPDFILGIKPFFNNLATIPITLGKFFIPTSLSTMPLFNGVSTAIGLIILLGVFGLIWKSIKAKQWLAPMGFIWFLAFTIPPMFFKLYFSSFLLEYYEHRSYLPYIGLIIMFCSIINQLIERSVSKNIIWLPSIAVLVFIPLASIHSDDYKDSIAFFGSAAEHSNPGAATKLGEIYMTQRDFPNALTDFDGAIEMSDKQYPPAFFNRGKVKSAFVKDHKAAEEDFTTTVQLDSTYIDAFIARADERIFLQNIQGAMSDLAMARHLDSTNASVYFTTGKAYIAYNNFKDAVSSFSKAISFDEGNAEAYNDRAFARYKLKEYTTALEDCNKAIELFPQYLNAYYNKGMIYYETAKPAIAIKTFDTTLLLANNFYLGYFYRGMAKKQVNDSQGACKDWQESVNLGFTLAQDTIKKYCK